MSGQLRLNTSIKLLVCLAMITCSALTFARGNSDTIIYSGCWNSDYAPPLLECKELGVSKLLDTVSVDGRLEARLAAKPDKDFHVLRSQEVPIVVPKLNYEKSDAWVYEGRKYIKLKKGMPALTEGEKVDVVAIVDNIETIKDWRTKISLHDPGIMENIRCTFWYYPGRGVEAISVGTNSSDMQTYFCVKKPCLFAPAER